MSSWQEGTIPKFIRRAMPDASEAELLEATATFKEYMAVVLRIYQRIHREASDSDSHDSS